MPIFEVRGIYFYRKSAILLFMRFTLAVLWILPLFANSSQETTVDLCNPVYQGGILYSNEGGVIQNSDIRIQARNIQYTRKEGIHKIEADGDLFIEYKGKIYVGSELEYDFLTQSGVVYNGKTFSSLLYVSGDAIYLNPDGSYRLEGASITSCENQDSTWDLHAKKLTMKKEDLLEAERVRFRLFQIPTLWLPSFKVNLKKFKEPIFRYSVNWDKGQGPRGMIRYRFYSWRDFAMYGRVEYRWRTGWGGAFETEYLPTDYPTTFVTRSYLGTDRLETAPDKMRRYRLQGAFHTKSQREKTTAMLTWDKYSDVRMPGDFQSEDFEINTAKKTILSVRHEERDWIVSGKLRPRVNTFESIKQDLPTVFAASKPMEWQRAGVFFRHYTKVSYLDFLYSNHLIHSIHSYHSARVELREELFRPFQFGPLGLTPSLGGVALLYSNSPSTQAKALGILSYGARAYLRGTKSFDRYRHLFEPYTEFTGLSHPTVSPDRHYLFSIQDGYNTINQLKVGFRNLLFSQRRGLQEPSFSADLYANAFFADLTIPQVIPRLYLDLSWRLSSMHADLNGCWNFREQVVDTLKARLRWTFSENAAFSIEGRYRSRYDWRKADHTNFILDVTRSQTELLLSPLSDQRASILLDLFVRLTPFWECHIQSHHGFLRHGEDPYNEVRVDLFTWLSSALKLRLSYSHLDKDDRVTAGISLVKK